MSSGDSITTHGQIIVAETSVRKEPYSLPQGFSWDTLDLTNPKVVGNVISVNKYLMIYFENISGHLSQSGTDSQVMSNILMLLNGILLLGILSFTLGLLYC